MEEKKGIPKWAIGFIAFVLGIALAPFVHLFCDWADGVVTGNIVMTREQFEEFREGKVKYTIWVNKDKEFEKTTNESPTK